MQLQRTDYNAAVGERDRGAVVILDNLIPVNAIQAAMMGQQKMHTSVGNGFRRRVYVSSTKIKSFFLYLSGLNLHTFANDNTIVQYQIIKRATFCFFFFLHKDFLVIIDC